MLSMEYEVLDFINSKPCTVNDVINSASDKFRAYKVINHLYESGYITTNVQTSHVELTYKGLEALEDFKHRQSESEKEVSKPFCKLRNETERIIGFIAALLTIVSFFIGQRR